MKNEGYLRIEQVAKATGLTKRAIRFWEEIGLLPPARRSGGNYRLYSPEAVRRVAMIVRFRTVMGLTLAQTKVVVDAEEEMESIRETCRAGGSGAGGNDASVAARRKRMISLLDRQLALIDEKIGALRELRAGVAARKDVLRKAAPRKTSGAPRSATGSDRADRAAPRSAGDPDRADPAAPRSEAAARPPRASTTPKDPSRIPASRRR